MLEKIKNLGLKWKFGVIVLVALLFIITILLLWLRSSLDAEFETLYGDAGSKGIFVAELLANELQPILEEDKDSQEVEKIVDKYYSIYGIYGVRYIMIQDGSGAVIADTFKDVVQDSLVKLNPLSDEKRTQSFQSGGKQYFDSAVPIEFPVEEKEQRIGAVRIGLVDQNTEAATWENLKAEHVKGVFRPILILSIILALLIAVLVSLAFWYLVLRRIETLSDATERMSFGDLETAVQIKSQDEIGVLEDTLERMRVNLKDAIERLKRRR